MPYTYGRAVRKRRYRRGMRSAYRVLMRSRLLFSTFAVTKRFQTENTFNITLLPAAFSTLGAASIQQLNLLDMSVFDGGSSVVSFRGATTMASQYNNYVIRRIAYHVTPILTDTIATTTYDTFVWGTSTTSAPVATTASNYNKWLTRPGTKYCTLAAGGYATLLPAENNGIVTRTLSGVINPILKDSGGIGGSDESEYWGNTTATYSGRDYYLIIWGMSMLNQTTSKLHYNLRYAVEVTYFNPQPIELA